MAGPIMPGTTPGSVMPVPQAPQQGGAGLSQSRQLALQDMARTDVDGAFRAGRGAQATPGMQGPDVRALAWEAARARIQQQGTQMPDPSRILSMRQWLSRNHPKMLRLRVLPKTMLSHLEREYDNYLKREMALFGLELEAARTKASVDYHAARTDAAWQVGAAARNDAARLLGDFTRGRSRRSRDGRVTTGAGGAPGKTIESVIADGFREGKSTEEMQEIIDLYLQSKGRTKGGVGLGDTYSDALENLAGAEQIGKVKSGERSPMEALRELQEAKHVGAEESLLGKPEMSRELIGDPNDPTAQTGLLEQVELDPIGGFIDLHKWGRARRLGVNKQLQEQIDALVEQYRPSLEDIIRAHREGYFEPAKKSWLGGIDEEDQRMKQEQLTYLLTHALSAEEQKKLMAAVKSYEFKD